MRQQILNLFTTPRDMSWEDILLNIVLAAVLLVLTRWVKQTKNWHPIVFIGLSALVGVVFRFAGA